MAAAFPHAAPSAADDLTPPPSRGRMAMLFLLAAALAATGEYSALGPQRRANASAGERLAALRDANTRLRPLAGQLDALRAQNAQLTLQWQAAQARLPALRSSDEFLRQLESAARSAQVTIRTVTAQPPVVGKLYVEAPYSIQLDGSFPNLLRFYDKLAHLPQLMAVTDWNVAAMSATGGAAKTYQYRPGTTIHAACKVSTYYSPAGGAE